MPTATGRLRYSPLSNTHKRPNTGWLILDCGMDWYGLYAPPLQLQTDPRWGRVIDLERPVVDGRLGREVRLALIRPVLAEPRWGPHISVVRGDGPRKHVALWSHAIRIGDLEERLESVGAIAKHHRQKAENLEDVLPFIAPRRVNDIAQMRRQVHDALRIAEGYDQEAQEVQRTLSKSRRQWVSEATSRGVPVGFTPGTPIRFKFQFPPMTNGRHWWFRVECKTLEKVRGAFGLPRNPSTAFHLTFAVLEGCDVGG